MGECQILAFRKEKEVPQFIASTRHVSMDAVSMQSIVWNNNQLRVALKGVPETSERYYFAVPEKYTLKDVNVQGALCDMQMNKSILCVEVEFKSSDAIVILAF